MRNLSAQTVVWDSALNAARSLQAGPVKRVSIPQEADGTHKGFAFCQFTSVASASYAKQLFQDLVCLFGRPLRINFSHQGNRDT